ncbi:MAG: hypothetical protein ACRDD0_00410 [Bacteroidales bacterium]
MTRITHCFRSLNSIAVRFRILDGHKAHPYYNDHYKPLIDILCRRTALKRNTKQSLTDNKFIL